MYTDFGSVPQHYAARTREKMQEVLMNPHSSAPAIFYYMIRGGHNQKNITVWEPGKVGGEYIKTYGHYHVGDLDENYWVLLGTGVAVLQKLAVNDRGQTIPDRVAEFRALCVKSGDRIYMPPGYGHLLTNTGDTFLVTADDSPVNFKNQNEAGSPGHADYATVRQTRGFAFYVVEHEGKPALVKNPRFHEVTKLETGGLPTIAPPQALT
ncbi:hypothetical protein M1523_04800 [Patescibacteria group bacterium]|nr:hypothetical protein [Patescibacteria group bacterium]